MAHIEGEIVIDRPVDVVFDFVADERNEAHNLHSSKREARTQRVLDLYAKELGSFDEVAAAEDSVHLTLGFVVALCMGFLASFEHEVERFKEIVETLDQALNPHRHLQSELVADDASQ